MPSFRQSNFSGGELSPTLLGRNDLEKYGSALKTCRNFIPTVDGNALNRPGTQYLGSVKDESKTVRLVPFIYSDTDTYVLEFGELYIRFWKNGTRLGAPYEVVTPYVTADLPYLKWAQVGDVLHIAHRSHAPRKLSRLADTSWTLAELSVALLEPLFRDPDTPAEVTMAPAAVDALPSPTSGNPAREWQWQASLVCQDGSTGVIFETAAELLTYHYDGISDYPASYIGNLATLKLPVSATTPITLRRAVTSGLMAYPPGYNTYRVLSVRFYRGRANLFGFIGETKTRDFVDVGEAPDYSIQPPQARNPFEVYNSSNTLVRTERPSAISFFEQRLAFGRTDYRPGWVWLSATGNYKNFDRHIQLLEDDAVELELASFRREEIRSLLGMDKLFCFTSGGVWTLAGNGGPLTAFSLQAIKQTDEGASWVSPLIVRDALLYVRSFGKGVNELDYENNRDKYAITDLTLLSRHLFDRHSIVDWCYAHDPFNLIWAVRDDGALLSLTINKAAGVYGWARHDSDDAVFESITSVPESGEDAVYFCVRRTVNGATRRYIERFSRRRESNFLDCAGVYPYVEVIDIENPDVPVPRPNPLLVPGLPWLVGKPYVISLDGVVFGPFSGAASIDDPPEYSVMCIGLPYLPQLEFLDLANPKQDIRPQQKQVTRVFLDVDGSTGVWAGQTFDNMSEWRSRRVANDYGSIGEQSQQIAIAVSSKWNTGGRACIELRDPVPLNVIGVSREVTFGGA